MAPPHNPQRHLLLFGRVIPLQAQEQEQNGGDLQGWFSASMELLAAKKKEKNHGTSSGVQNSNVSNSPVKDSKKRKRPEDDHDQHNDSSSELTQQDQIITNKSHDDQHRVPTAVVAVQTELKLFVGSPSTRTQKQQQPNIRLTTLKIERFRHYRPSEEEEERLRGVSTRLRLYSDPWKVKKRLTPSDLGSLTRVLIPSNSVNIHVKPFMVRAGIFDQVESLAGLEVSVWDVETDSVHKMLFKRWSSSKSFILVGRWCQEFVDRRSLKEGDEVGFLWDPYSFRFFFRVISRAPNSNPDPLPSGRWW